VWATGMVDSRRVRISLKTCDSQRGARRLVELDDRIAGKPRKTIVDSVTAFHAQHEDKGGETKRKYKRILQFLSDCCSSGSIRYLDQVEVESMDRYTLWRARVGLGQGGQTSHPVFRVLPRSRLDSKKSGEKSETAENDRSQQHRAVYETGDHRGMRSDRKVEL
jgi:hypothetical protein